MRQMWLLNGGKVYVVYISELLFFHLTNICGECLTVNKQLNKVVVALYA